MCTIICTVRTVFWYIMSLAGTLMILVSLLTNKWIEAPMLSKGSISSTDGLLNAGTQLINNINNMASGDIETVKDVTMKNVGLFTKCMEISDHEAIIQGECIPDLKHLQTIFTDLDESKYPHLWRGAVLLFGLGLALMVITDLFALLTACCRSCICCSVFTICGSLQTFAGIFFSLGLIAYPAGWGSTTIKNDCGDSSEPFVLGSDCNIGVAFWVAVAGTVCTLLASSLAIFAYQSTRSSKCEQAQDDGEHCICLI